MNLFKAFATAAVMAAATAAPANAEAASPEPVSSQVTAPAGEPCIATDQPAFLACAQSCNQSWNSCTSGKPTDQITQSCQPTLESCVATCQPLVKTCAATQESSQN